MTRMTARRLGMHAIGACALLAVWALPAAAEEEVPARPQAAAVAETPPPVPALKPAVPRAASERGELPLAISLSFAPDSTGLDGAARLRLSEVARALADAPGQRLAIYAYAGGPPEAAAEARRTSLLRAVAVRSFLVDQGVSGERMAVKALGQDVKGGAKDRVDIILSGR